MIYNRVNFFSKVLCQHVDVDILLPSMSDNETYLANNLDSVYQKKEYPVLYLLHGALDDHTMWLRYSRIEEYAQKANIAVVMPSGQNGFYTDAKMGLNYFTFITEELPRMLKTYFPISNKREDTYITGPSMGGYGASKIALRCIDRFKAFADLSGALDHPKLEKAMCAMGFDFFRYDLVFGGSDKTPGTLDDVYYLANYHKDSPLKPEAYVYCGLDDSANLEMNKRFYDELVNNNFIAHFTDGEGGHDFAYWDNCIKDFLEKISH